MVSRNYFLSFNKLDINNIDYSYILDIKELIKLYKLFSNPLRNYNSLYQIPVKFKKLFLKYFN